MRRLHVVIGILIGIGIATSVSCHITPAPVRVVTTQLPITVGDPDEMFPGVAQAAVDLWNAQIGCEVLQFVGTVPADAEFKPEPDSGGPIARENRYRAKLNRTNGCKDDPNKCERAVIGLHVAYRPPRSRMWIDKPRAHCKQMQIALHELGHAMGLDHTPRLIMRDHIYPCDDWGRFFVYRVDDSSLEALRVAYCR